MGVSQSHQSGSPCSVDRTTLQSIEDIRGSVNALSEKIKDTCPELLATTPSPAISSAHTQADTKDTGHTRDSGAGLWEEKTDQSQCDRLSGYVWCDAKQSCIRPWEEKCRHEDSFIGHTKHGYEYQHDARAEVLSCRLSAAKSLGHLKHKCGESMAHGLKGEIEHLCENDPTAGHRCGHEVAKLTDCVIHENCSVTEKSIFNHISQPCQREMVALSRCATHSR